MPFWHVYFTVCYLKGGVWIFLKLRDASGMLQNPDGLGGIYPY